MGDTSDGLDIGREPTNPDGVVTQTLCDARTRLIINELRHTRSDVRKVAVQTEKIPKIEAKLEGHRGGILDRVIRVVAVVLTAGGMLVGAVLWIQQIRGEAVEAAKEAAHAERQATVSAIRAELRGREIGPPIERGDP